MPIITQEGSKNTFLEFIYYLLFFIFILFISITTDGVCCILNGIPKVPLNSLEIKNSFL